MKVKPFQTPAPRAEAVDVPLAELERRIARQKFEQRMAPLAELLAHPEAAHGKPASAGELAEYRHLRIDGDPDWTVHPFPDLIKHGRNKEAS